MELKGKVVFITGSSSGIGEATAYRFAKQGSKVIINCLKNLKGAERVAKKCEKLGAEVLILQGDVSNEKDVNKMFKSITNKFGILNILINNAGSVDNLTFREAKTDEWIKVINNNLIGTMLCSQKAIEIMEKQGNGKILNTASIRGLENGGRETIMAYSAAKAGVINFTKTLAKLVAPTIQVNAIAPGFVLTPNYDSVPEKTKTAFIAGTLLKKWLKVDDIAEGFEYLAKADGLTGEVLVIDAGWTMKF